MPPFGFDFATSMSQPKHPPCMHSLTALLSIRTLVRIEVIFPTHMSSEKFILKAHFVGKFIE